MRALLQRVKKASVEVDGEIVGSIKQGLLIFFSCKQDDQIEMIKKLSDKILNFRIFPDENDKMNLSILDVKGQILVVSQFTLYADTKKGRRPSFVDLMDPENAIKLYETFIDDLKKSSLLVQNGVFGAKMQVSLINDGPLTFIIDV